MLGYTSFYGVFLAMGVFITWFTLWYFWWQQWRMNNVYIETTGVIVGKRVVDWEEVGPVPQVQVRYRAGDRECENWNRRCGYPYLRDFAAIKIGDQRPVWFDPAKPNAVIVERGYAIPLWLFYPMLALGLILTVCAGNTIVRGIIAFCATESSNQ